MLKVLLDARMDQGGAGRYCRELARSLAAIAGLDLHVANRRSGPIASFATMPFTPWGRMLVGRQAAAAGVDVAHGMHFELPVWRGPRLVTIQDLIPLDFPASMANPVRRRYFASVVDRAIQGADRILVPSELTASSIASRGADPAKVDVIPLWPSHAFTPLSPHEVDAARARFAGGARYIAAVSHPRPHKNLSTLFKASSLLASEGMAVVFAGADPRVEGMRWVGSLSDEDLRRFMGGAEVFVLPSLIEGFGLPAVEALACGTPVLCGPGVGALPWIRSCAVVGDVTEAAAIADTLMSLLQDEARLAELSQAAPASVEKLTLDRATHATLAAYEKVIGRPH